MAKPRINTGKIVKKSIPVKWFNNVAKSLGYASSEVVRELIPSISDFVLSNKETAIDLVKDLRQSKTIMKRFAAMIDSSEQMGHLKDAAKNAVADLKSGNIYNEARVQKQIEDEIFGDFDMSPLGESKDQSSPTVRLEETVVKSGIATAAPIVASINNQTEVMAKAAVTTAKLQATIAQQQMLFDKRIGDSMIGGLTSINDNISALVNFQSTSMTKYIGASLKYYEDNLRLISEQIVEMKKMTEGIVPKTQEKPKEDQVRQAFLSTGGIDIKGYLGVLKKNFMGAAEQSPIVSPIMMMLKEPAVLKSFAANPLMFLSTKIASAFIPSALKMAMTSLDKSFSSFFPALFMKLNRTKGSIINDLFNFSDAFGVKMPTKTSADLTLRNRGQIAFDGDTKTAITEVIPGYLRKILAAISGQEEIGYDFNLSKFKTVHAMAKEYNVARDQAALGDFRDSQRIIDLFLKEMVNFKNPESKDNFKKQFDEFFIRLAQRDTMLNPNDIVDRDGNVRDEVAEIYGFDSPQELKLAKDILKNMKKVHMKMVGKDVIASRESTKRLHENIEKNPSMYNYNLLYGSGGFDENIKRGDKDAIIGKKNAGGTFGTDMFGKTSTDYLRDITKLLAGGIIVFPQKATSVNTGSITSPIAAGSHASVIAARNSVLAEMIKTEEAQEKLEKTQKSQYISMNPDAMREAAASARTRGQSVVESRYDLKNISEGQLQQAVWSQFDQEEQANSKKMGVAAWLGKFLKGGAQDKYNQMLETVNKVLQTPVKLLTGFMTKIDNTMYELIFGKGTSGGDKFSFFTITLDKITDSFGKFFDWTKDTFFTPMTKLLIGKDGILTQLKESNFVKSIKEKGKAALTYMFGNYDEAGNKLSGGLFTNVGNEILDIGKSMRYYFTGTSYTDTKGTSHPENKGSVFGEVGKVFKSFGENIKKYFFGDKDSNDPNDSKGIFGTIGSSLLKGFQNFHSLIFGHEKMQGAKQTFDQFTQTMKERAPKALAWGTIGAGAGMLLGGKLGLLGALFLPGGPIGGAIVGTALGFLAQSDKFKDWAFGAMDKNTNERIGGFVSANTQRFFKKHKVGIIGGATLGAAKAIMGFGLLPGMLLGGPITGALLGIAASITFRSDKFQDWVFGKKNEAGDRENGIFARMFSKFRGKRSKEENKEMAGNAAAGAIGGAGLAAIIGQFGILGLALTPAGPIGGAILGAAAGILISSKKWRERLFGTMQDDGMRHGGLFGKLINWTNMQIMEPMKLKFAEMNLNIGEWFTKSIKNPFLDALEPMKAMYKDFFDNMKKMFKAGWDGFRDMIGHVFEKFVGLPFGKFMENNVMKPMKKFLSTLISGIGKIFGSVLSAPIKVLSAITGSYNQGKEEKSTAEWKKGKQFRKGKGILYAIGARMFGAYDDADKAELEGKLNTDIDYREKRYKDKEKRDAETDAYYEEKHRKAKLEIDAYEERLKRYKSQGYNNIDENIVSSKDTVPGDRFQGSGQGGGATADLTRRDRVAAGAAGTNLGGGTGAIPLSGTSTPPTTPPGAVPSAIATTPSKSERARQEKADKRAANKKDKQERRSKKKQGKGATVSDENDTEGVRSKIHEQTATTASTTGGAVQRSTGGGGKFTSSNDILQRIADDVSAMRKHMETNMNGVGYNINAIKNILRKKLGMKEGEGEADFENKEYRTWFQKAKDMLLSPFTWAKKKLLNVWNNLTDGVKKVWDKITGIGTLAIKGLTALKDGVVWTAKTLIEAGATIIKLPYKLAEAFGSFVKAAGTLAIEFAQSVGPALKESLLGIADLFRGFMGMIGNSLAGAGLAIKESLVGFGKGVGDILWGIGEIGYAGMKAFADGMLAAGPIVIDFLKESTKTAVTFTLDMIKMVGEKLIDTAGSLLQFIVSPIKFLGHAVGKLFGFTQKVEVVGGYLDTVKHIDHIIDDRPVPVHVVAMGNATSSGVPQSSYSSSGSAFTPTGLGTGSSTMSGTVPGQLMLGTGAPEGSIAGAPTVEAGASAAEVQRQTLENKGASVNVIAQRTTLREKWAAFKNQMKQTSLLQKIANSTTTFKEGWDAIFSKKGLITGALLLGLPLLWKAFKWITDGGGFFKVITDGLSGLAGIVADGISGAFSKILCKLGFSSFCDTTSGSGGGIIDTITDSPKLTEDVTFGGIKLLNAAVRGGSKAGAAGIESATRLGVAVKQGFKSIPTSLEKLFPSTTKFLKKFTTSTPTTTPPPTVPEAPKDTGTKGKKKGKKGKAPKPPKMTVVDPVPAAEVKAAQGGTIKNFITAAGKSIAQMAEKLGEKFPSISGLTGKISSIFSRVLTPEVLAKPAAMVRITEFLTRIGAQGIVPMLNAITVTYGAVTGLFEGAELFKVHQDDVDNRMAVISSAMKAFLYFSWFVVIDIVNQLAIEFLGIDLLKRVATLLYSLISSEEDLTALITEQIKFENEAKDAGMSTAAYSDKTNKGFWGRTAQVGKDLGAGIYDLYDQVSGNKADRDKKDVDFEIMLKGKQDAIFKKTNADRALKNLPPFSSYNEMMNNEDRFIPVPVPIGGGAVPAPETKPGGMGGEAPLTNQPFIGPMPMTPATSPTSTNKPPEADKKPNMFQTLYSDVDKEMRSRLGIHDNRKMTFGQLVGLALSEPVIMLLGTDPKKTTQTIYGAMLTFSDWWTGANGGYGFWPLLKKSSYEGVIKPFEDLGKWLGGKLSDLGDWWSGENEGYGFWPLFKKSTYEGVIKPFADIGKWLGSKLSDLGDWWSGENEGYGFWPLLKKSSYEGVIKPFEDIGKWLGNKATDFGEWWSGDNGGYGFWPLLKKSAYEGVVDPFVRIGKSLGDVLNGINDWWNGLKTALSDLTAGLRGKAQSEADKPLPGQTLTPTDAIGYAKQLKASGSNNQDIREKVKAKYGTSAQELNDIVLSLNAGGGNTPPLRGGFGESLNNFAFYSQSDPRWGQEPYLKSGVPLSMSGERDTMGWRACGPTAMSMVATQLTGKDVLPPTLANYATANGFSNNVGTTWGFFPAIANKFGLNITRMEDSESAKQFPSLLAKGMPVILSGQTAGGVRSDSSPFTPGGHFVVATGIQGDKVFINNPSGKSRSGVYSLSNIMPELLGAWGFSNPSGTNMMAPSFDNANNFTGSATTGTEATVSSMFDLFPQLMTDMFKGSDMGKADDSVMKFGAAMLEQVMEPFNISTPGTTGTTSTASVIGATPSTSAKGKILTQFDPMSEAQINQWIDKAAPQNSPFRGQGAVFLKASNKTGLDPRYIVAHAAVESAWGTSEIARKKNNYFGIGAFNASPGKSALSFSSGLDAGIVGGADWIKRNYTDKGQNSTYSMIYGDPNHRYAVYDDGRPNDNWIESIDSVMASAYSGGGKGPSTMGSDYKRSSLQFTDKRITPELLNFSSTGNNRNTEELLQKAVDVLGVISGHTSNTSSGIDDLSKKGFQVNVNSSTGGIPSNQINSSQGVVNINPVNLTTGGGPLGSQMRDSKNEKYNREYKVASEIAKGRKY